MKSHGIKKSQQLGMNAGTASYRLIKDLLFDFVEKNGHVCFRCKQKLNREDFSVDHIEAWLDSENPQQLFFDLNNIAYSHKTCNTSAARRPNKVCNTLEERSKRYAEIQKRAWSKLSKEDQKRIRREKYLKYGC